MGGDGAQSVRTSVVSPEPALNRDRIGCALGAGSAGVHAETDPDAPALRSLAPTVLRAVARVQGDPAIGGTEESGSVSVQGGDSSCVAQAFQSGGRRDGS
jgi:hypothetical protein